MCLGSGPRAFACFSSLLAACSGFAQYAGSEAPPEDLKKGFDSITQAECKGWLTYLAGPETQGRGSGQPGFQKAADYVAARFKKYGLKPAGDNGTYFQMVPFSRVRPRAAESSLGTSDDKVHLAFGKDFSIRGAQDIDAKGNLVFIKLKGKGPDAAIPDSADLKGKIVVYVADEQVPRTRLFAIMQKQPGLVLTIGKVVPAEWSVSPKTSRRFNFVQGRLSPTAAEQLAKAAGVDAAVIDPKVGEAGATVTPSTTEVHAKLAVESEDVNVPNVVGLLPGSDPILKDEYVGIGAHLDHLGINNGVVYPGADDDGSGTTALLAVIHAMTSNPVKPKRSILFMNFCGEELGLIGSAYLAAHPMIPLDKMVCELQMDMVGRNAEDAKNKPQENIQTIRLVGSKRISTGLHNLILDENKYIGFDFKYDAEDVYTRSDHYNFAAKGIPIAFLFDGFHPDYHQPTDTVDKINWDKIANTAKLYYLVGEAAADRPGVAFEHDVVVKTGG